MAILRYRETFVGISNWVYEILETDNDPNLVHTSPKGKKVYHEPKIVSKEEAKAIIKKKGLVIAHRLNSGEIVWDTPDRAYQVKWQGIKIEK